MSLAKKATQGIIWLTGVQIGGMLVSFGANIILARLLVPADFGSFSLALSLSELFFVLTAWSFGLAVIQAKTASQEFIDTGYLLSMVVGTAAAVIVLVSSFLLKRLYSLQVLYFLWIFSALSVVGILGNYKAALLERNLDYGKYALIQFSARVIPWLGAVVLAWFGAGAWSFVGQQAIMALIVFFGYHTLSGYRFRWRLDRKAMGRLFRFGRQMLVSRGLEVGFYRIGYLIVGTWLGTTQLGYYNQALTLSEMGHRLGRPAVGQVPFAAYSRLQGDTNKLSRGYALVTYFMLRFLTPVALIFLLLGDQVIVLLYGKKWQEAGPLLQVLAFYALALPVYENMKELLYSQNRLAGAIFTRLVQLIFLVPGMCFALKKFGVSGAVYALDMGVTIGIVVIYIETRKLVRVEVKHLILPPLCAALGTFVIWRAGLVYLRDWQPKFSDAALGTILISALYFGLLFGIERRKSWAYFAILFETLGLRKLKTTEASES
jgi:teichuronic acid exporter